MLFLLYKIIDVKLWENNLKHTGNTKRDKLNKVFFIDTL